MKKKVEIFDISYEGSGVGKVDGQVVFVPKSLPTEGLEVEIEKSTSKFLIGKVEKILQSSVHRCEAVCPYFEICGGCAFQHCDRAFEQKCKTEILQKELSKVGFLGEILFVKGKKRFSYRNKIKLEVCGERLGYFKAKSHDFFEVICCPIASEKINYALEKVVKFLKENRLSGLKNVYLKEAGEKVAICFLFKKNSQKTQKNIKNLHFLSNFSVFFAFGEILETDDTEILSIQGEDNLAVGAFSQVNDEVEELLYDFVVKSLQGKRVVNAYSGQGKLTRMIAKQAEFVCGIEMQKSAHLEAEKFEIDNVLNICAKVEDVIGEIVRQKQIDCIVLNPAREGCKKEVLVEILRNKIPEVVCVSCNFSTLVRDLSVLKEGYEIKSVTIFDMFPCTANMETVVILKQKR